MMTENDIATPNLSPPPGKPWLTPESKAIQAIEAILYELDRVQPAKYNERPASKRVLGFIMEKHTGGPGRKPRSEGGK